VAIPVPAHYDVDVAPLVTIEVNEDWYSVLLGILELSLDRGFWEGDAADYVLIEQAILELMTLGD